VVSEFDSGYPLQNLGFATTSALESDGRWSPVPKYVVPLVHCYYDRNNVSQDEGATIE